jgi:hypothetical protein
MATYDASVRKALSPQQEDLIKQEEHCSADPEKLATVLRAFGHQVRIKRTSSEYGLYTVSEVRQESPANIVRMGKTGRERLGTSDEFAGTLDSQVPRLTCTDDEAETLPPSLLPPCLLTGALPCSYPGLDCGETARSAGKEASGGTGQLSRWLRG